MKTSDVKYSTVYFDSIDEKIKCSRRFDTLDSAVAAWNFMDRWFLVRLIGHYQVENVTL